MSLIMNGIAKELQNTAMKLQLSQLEISFSTTR